MVESRHYVTDSGNDKGIPDYGQPIIYGQPQSQTNLSLSVTNTGASPLAYQWLFNGTNGATTNILNIANFQAANAGSYHECLWQRDIVHRSVESGGRKQSAAHRRHHESDQRQHKWSFFSELGKPIWNEHI